MSQDLNLQQDHGQQLEKLGVFLFQCLHKIDGEATLAASDSEIRVELRLVERLQACLNDAGMATQREVAYPGGSRKKCDLVVQLPAGRVWLEVKLAWKAWVGRDNQVQATNPFFYPYLTGEGKSHSAVQDIEKLQSITVSDGQFVAGLLVGFDSLRSPMDGDVAELVKRATLNIDGWQVLGPFVWPNRWDPICRHPCWFWSKKVSLGNGEG